MIHFYYIILILLNISFGISILLMTNKRLNHKRHLDYMTHFETYSSILQYHQDKAYDIIYKDKLLVYSLEATKVNDEQFEQISKDFSILLLKMIGPILEKEFVKLYGEENFYFNLMDYVHYRYENDEIRKDTVKDLMDSEVDDDDKGAPYGEAVSNLSKQLTGR